MNFSYLGAAIGACAGIKGCEGAPHVLREKIPFTTILSYDGDGHDYKALRQYFNSLSKTLYEFDKKGLPFIIGGDHSCAIGSWHGIGQCYQDIGLIWVDAHMDSHIPETSLTGHIHGMPLAILLGYGHSQLLGPKPTLKPENVVLIGIRSYEKDEAELLKKLGVKVHFMDEIAERGIEQVLLETFQGLSQRVKVGLSIDLDAFDPHFMPGVGTPAKDGIDLEAFIATLKKLDLARCCGIEIAEYNPTLDKNGLTQQNVLKLIEAFTVY